MAKPKHAQKQGYAHSPTSPSVPSHGAEDSSEPSSSSSSSSSCSVDISGDSAYDHDGEIGEAGDDDDGSSAPDEGQTTTTTTTPDAPLFGDPDARQHLGYLQQAPADEELNELGSASFFAPAVLRHAQRLAAAAGRPDPYPQYRLLAGDAELLASLKNHRHQTTNTKIKKTATENKDKHNDNQEDDESNNNKMDDPRLFFNVAAPSSIFICGSQGSGKSHTLSCVLESCLVPAPAARLGPLPRPLAGLLCHYDSFAPDAGGDPCEAAHLATDAGVRVRVLCAPTNVVAMRATYAKIPLVTVEPLRLNDYDLSTKKMLDLMAAGESSSAGPAGMPLYMYVIQRILREMRLEGQERGRTEAFRYAEFRRRVEDDGGLLPGQKMPLQQRLDTLQSFMVPGQVSGGKGKGAKGAKGEKGTDWALKAGTLTIVDLTCPCVTADMACSLFNICVSLFLEAKQPTLTLTTTTTNAGNNNNNNNNTQAVGRVIALDEAHKYMSSPSSDSDGGGGGDEASSSPGSRALTSTLLQTIRLQRHSGTRVVVATQEPSVSPRLMDLCSATLVHRFSSPAWMRALAAHLAGVSPVSRRYVNASDRDGG